MTTTAAAIQEEKLVQQEIPKVFIAEIIDGVPLYYKGYKEFIHTPDKAESVMGASSIHFILLDFFYALLVRKLDESKYWRAGGESGIKLGKHNSLNLDLAIYLKEKFPTKLFSKHYVEVAPELVIEIDTSIEMEEFTDDEYVFKKTKQLLDFGTGKVIWVFSATNRVMIAEPNAPWQIHPWSTTLSLMEDITFNIEAYCREAELDHLLNP